MASVTKRDEKIWRVQIRKKGFHINRTFPDMKSAQLWAITTEEQIANGTYIDTDNDEKKQ